MSKKGKVKKKENCEQEAEKKGKGGLQKQNILVGNLIKTICTAKWALHSTN